MVDEIDEYLGVCVRAKNGARGGSVSEKDFEKVFLCNVIPAIVDLACVINVDTLSRGGLVEDLAREWVLIVIGNVVIGQMDYLVTGNTVSKHDLDGVMSV